MVMIMMTVVIVMNVRMMTIMMVMMVLVMVIKTIMVVMMMRKTIMMVMMTMTMAPASRMVGTPPQPLLPLPGSTSPSDSGRSCLKVWTRVTHRVV